MSENNGWIKCSDKLPELGMLVLFFEEENEYIGIGLVGRIESEPVSDDWYAGSYKYLVLLTPSDEKEILGTAVYWQPLPQPPID